MEFLVTMTTTVPDGIAEEVIADVKAREAAHSRELAAQGSLLRLWRPPLEPGEWRTLGLFVAEDAQHLESVLASMPLRIWRADEVQPLLPHPNDPGLPWDPSTGQEFLLTFSRSPSVGALELAFLIKTQAARVQELALSGIARRLWLASAEPTAWLAFGLWQAMDQPELETALNSLPLGSRLAVHTTPLTPHPSDPAKGQV